MSRPPVRHPDGTPFTEEEMKVLRRELHNIAAKKRREMDPAAEAAKSRNKYLKFRSSLSTDLDRFIGNIVDTARRRSKVCTAKSRNFDFNIDAAYIKRLMQAKGFKCAKTGVSLTFGSHENTRASLDRIDSNIGYVKGNCQIVTKSYNIAKNKLSQKEMDDMVMAAAEIIMARRARIAA